MSSPVKVFLVTIAVTSIIFQTVHCAPKNESITEGRSSRNGKSPSFFDTQEDEDDGEQAPEGMSFFPDSSEPGLTASRGEKALTFPEKAQKTSSEEKHTIDAIISATRSGRQLTVDQIDEAQLTEVISDPKIREQLDAGNEAEARGYIRDKLCALGLVACSKPSKNQYHGHHGHGAPPGYGPQVHYKPGPSPHYKPGPLPSKYKPGYHHGPTYHHHETHSHTNIPFPVPNYESPVPPYQPNGIPAKDVSLVQPVAVNPVGGVISAIPIGNGKQYYNNKPNYSPYPQPGPYQPHRTGPGPEFASASHSKPIYPSPQIYSQQITKPIVPLSLEKKVVEHVHHHVHHQSPGSQIPGSLSNTKYGEYGTIAEIGNGYTDGDFAAQKSVISIATPNGKEIGSYPQPAMLSPNYLGPPDHAKTCICVPLEQCYLDGEQRQSELESLGSIGVETIQGTGVPHSGLVGYGIDPRNNNKARALGIESNATDSEESTEDEDDENPSDEFTETTTLLPNLNSNETKSDSTNSRTKRETIEQSTNSTKTQVVKREGQGRRLDSVTSCRIRSIGNICCDPNRLKNPSLYLNQLNPSESNSFNQHVLYNPNTNAKAGFAPNNYGNFHQSSVQCGKRNAQGGVNGRVITAASNSLSDGETDFGEYPWQVAVLKKDGTFVCGGALIAGNHVATAAHCIKQLKSPDLRVRLGEWDVNHNTEFYPHFERQVTQVTIHPQFYAGNLLNDIAILRFQGHVDFSQYPHVSPVCLPQPNSDSTGKRCYVTGWGKDAFGKGGKYQNVLKEIDLPVVSNQDCEQKLKRTRLGPDFVLNPGFICAGGEAGKDACKGDGGGPLVCEFNGSWQLSGIVSWGVGCGQANVPGVYVDVAYYYKWVLDVINNRV